ncbi:MAG: hypothetical protein HIU89_17860 [Proteobacteria bacterium]|nr:hypothetical protein [Pseudomonadota bacterium]
MPLAIDKPLLASDIMEARELKDGKIFLLKGRDGSSLVLKAEPNVTGDKIKATAPVLKAIDASMKMKPLTQPEVLQLKQFLKSWKMYVDFIKFVSGTDTNLPISADEKKSMDELETCVNQYGTGSASGRSDIAKMSYTQMSTLSVALKVENKPSNDASWDEARSIFGQFVKTLNKSGGLEKLGQIVAGDFFIGNEDRFVSSGNGVQVQLYGEKHRLKVILNLGNVIIVKDAKGKSRPSMLDYMDPNTDFLDLNQTLSTMGRSQDWPMRVLLDRTARQAFAEKLVDDLEYILKPEKSLFGFNKLGGSRASNRVNDGIKAGIKAMIKSLGTRQAKLSPLIQSYYAELVKAKV